MKWWRSFKLILRQQYYQEFQKQKNIVPSYDYAAMVRFILREGPEEVYRERLAMLLHTLKYEPIMRSEAVMLLEQIALALGYLDTIQEKRAREVYDAVVQIVS